jgi:hypothetical protein
MLRLDLAIQYQPAYAQYQCTSQRMDIERHELQITGESYLGELYQKTRTFANQHKESLRVPYAQLVQPTGVWQRVLPSGDEELEEVHRNAA